MGGVRWDPSAWEEHAATVATKAPEEIFTSSAMPDELDPLKIKFRESRDSEANPNATPIILACDVTGSMGMIADHIVRQGLGTLVEEIIKRKPVPDPHIMCMGVGDANYDRAPLQVTQFEADIRIAKQLAEIYIEHGGGGNCFESYNLPWFFAATKTRLDCVEKGRRKGLLFTIGDEEAPAPLTADQIRRYVGEDIGEGLSNEALLEMVGRMYDVFHVIVEEGDYARHSRSSVVKSWNKTLGQGRVIRLSDHTKLAEVIVSAIQAHEGQDKIAVAKSWDGSTGLVVRDAIAGIGGGTALMAKPGVARTKMRGER
ncbi:MAG: hypothetical protein AB7G80_07595 [Dongiaceae bacterium]